MQEIIFFRLLSVTEIFTGWCRKSFEEILLSRCGNMKHILTNNFIQSIHIKQSTINIHDEAGTIFYLSLSDMFRPILFIISFSTMLCVSSPYGSLCVCVCVWYCCKGQFMSLCYIFFSPLIFMPLKYKYSSHPIFKHPKCKYFLELNVHFDNGHSFIWRNSVGLGDCKVEILWCCVRLLIATLNSN